MKIKLINALGISLLSALTCIPNSLISQNLEYAYDASGNRVKKELIFSSGDDDIESLRKKESIEDVFDESIVKLYPNPTQSKLTMELPSHFLENTSIRLLNPEGKLLRQIENPFILNEMDLSNESNGIYILQIIKKDKISTWRIIKN